MSISISLTDFKQGALSDEIWSHFKHLVKCCHEIKRLRRDLKNIQPHPPHLDPSSNDTKTKAKNRARKAASDKRKPREPLGEWEIAAMESISSIKRIATASGGKADDLLSKAIIESVGHVIKLNTGYELAAFESLAFDQFNATIELIGDHVEIAQRWHAQG
jgi:hypothetical protein